jgi:hypothetical protein
MTNEKDQGRHIAGLLRLPLNGGNADYLKGGFRQPGYGVPSGAAIDGSHAFQGSQGYYTPEGRKIFRDNVLAIRRVLESVRPKYIMKIGIGGQHTPFQGIAGGFALIDPQGVRIAGEYELGKDYEKSLAETLEELGASWEEIVIIPSSKSGSTDETMLIFVQVLSAMLAHLSGENGETFARQVLDILHEINFEGETERPGKDLFIVPGGSLIQLIAGRTHRPADEVKAIFKKLLERIIFETTNRPDQSRLAAFLKNSGLDTEVHQPAVIEMFDNVGGRWTGDLHMMTFLAQYGIDPELYWQRRRDGIREVRENRHEANRIGDQLLDSGCTDIALLVPDHLFWFGKSCEQNFNESIWQEGFANLVAVRAKDWPVQSFYYRNRREKLVINLTDTAVDAKNFNAVRPSLTERRARTLEETALAYADLFTLFYGFTNHVGTRLIARAMAKAGQTAGKTDLNDLGNPAARIAQENLFLRQPFVELGKKLLEERLSSLHKEEAGKPGSIWLAEKAVKEKASHRELLTNLSDFPANLMNHKTLRLVVRQAKAYADKNKRKLVPFIYLEGEKFSSLRDSLIAAGVEWVMQGTGDQHISYQQVLAQPKRYLPFLVSFVPDRPLAGLPAVGFAKGYLHSISPHLVRDYFAEASYQALLEQGGKSLFLRLVDTVTELDAFQSAFQK